MFRTSQQLITDSLQDAVTKKMTTCQSRKANVDMVAATQHMPALPLALFPALFSFLQGDIQSYRPRLDLSELFLHQTTQRTKITPPEILWNTV